jgi:glucokinase
VLDELGQGSPSRPPGRSRHGRARGPGADDFGTDRTSGCARRSVGGADRLHHSAEHRSGPRRQRCLSGEWSREHRVGAARGHHDVVMFTLGTGVGGGVISERTGSSRGRNGFAGELGHLVIVAGRPRTHRAESAGPSRRTRRGRRSSVRRRRRSRPDSADARVAVDASQVVSSCSCQASPGRLAVLEQVGTRLGVAIASVVSVLDPSIVVIGGGAGDAAAHVTCCLPLVPRSRTNLMGAAHRPIAAVVPAELGDDAGVIGAGLLADRGGRLADRTGSGSGADR